MKSRFAVSAILLLVCLSSLAEEKEPLYKQMCRAVVRLEHIQLAQQGGRPAIQFAPQGTAFFVAHSNQLYIVSARHVVNKPHDLQARVESLRNDTNQTEVILLQLPHEKWVFHQNDGDADTHPVDVAVMKIHWIKDRSIKHFLYAPPDATDRKKNQLPLEDPEPPQPILVFGFPSDVGFGLLEQRPLGRLGVVSMKTDKEFLQWDGKFGEERCCLIDARIFRGNSGSPVMNQMRITDSKPRLLGLVSAANNTLDFGIMAPVSRIRETIDRARSMDAAGSWKLIPGK